MKKKKKRIPVSKVGSHLDRLKSRGLGQRIVIQRWGIRIMESSGEMILVFEFSPKSSRPALWEVYTMSH